MYAVVLIIDFVVLFDNRRTAFVDLKQLGIPLLLVDQWTDLNASFLETTYENEFQHVNWEKVKSLFSVSGLMQLILNTESTIPRKSDGRDFTSNAILRLPDPFSPQKKSFKPVTWETQKKGSMFVKKGAKKGFGNFSLMNRHVKDPGPKHHCNTQLRPNTHRLDTNPFVNTVLDKVVTYHWRPCLKLWKNAFDIGTRNHAVLATPPVIFGLFDWVVWQHDFEDTDSYVVFANNSEAINFPRTILVYPEEKALSQLRRLLGSLVQKRATNEDERRTLVIAGQDTGLGGNLQYTVHRYLLDFFSDIWCTAKDRPDPFIQTIPLGLNPYYLVKAGVSAVTDMLTEQTRVEKERQLVFTGTVTTIPLLQHTTPFLHNYNNTHDMMHIFNHHNLILSFLALLFSLYPYWLAYLCCPCTVHSMGKCVAQFG